MPGLKVVMGKAVFGVLVCATIAAGFVGKPSAPVSWLFSLTSKMHVDGSKLTLHDLDDQVIIFSDRPNRKAARITGANLIQILDTMDQTDPPNAVVAGTNAADQTFEVVLELTTAVAGADGKSIVMDFEQVGDASVAEAIVHFNACTDCIASVFIDDVPDIGYVQWIVQHKHNYTKFEQTENTPLKTRP